MSLYKKVSDKRAVFLDLDNTVYAYGPCHREALKRACAFYGRSVEKIPRPDFIRLYNKARSLVKSRVRQTAASHSRLLYFKAMLELRGGKTDFGNTLRLENVYWDAFLGRMKLRAWVLPFLKYCRSEQKRVIVVTNLTTAIQIRKIRRLGLTRWVDFMITSEEAGVEKPHPKMMELAIRKARCLPREILVIGDNPKEDAFPSSLDFYPI